MFNEEEVEVETSLSLKLPQSAEELKRMVTEETFYPVLDTLKNLLLSVDEKVRLSSANTLTEIMGLRNTGGAKGTQGNIPSNTNIINLFSPKQADGFLTALKDLSKQGEIHDIKTVSSEPFEEEERYE